jgi:hypothetical protein
VPENVQALENHQFFHRCDYQSEVCRANLVRPQDFGAKYDNYYPRRLREGRSIRGLKTRFFQFGYLGHSDKLAENFMDCHIWFYFIIIHKHIFNN